MLNLFFYAVMFNVFLFLFFILSVTVGKYFLYSGYFNKGVNNVLLSNLRRSENLSAIW